MKEIEQNSEIKLLICNKTCEKCQSNSKGKNIFQK